MSCVPTRDDHRDMRGPAVSNALLATKFSVPRRAKAAVLRPRLLDLLDTGVQGPLTLVAGRATHCCAPDIGVTLCDGTS